MKKQFPISNFEASADERASRHSKFLMKCFNAKIRPLDIKLDMSRRSLFTALKVSNWALDIPISGGNR